MPEDSAIYISDPAEDRYSTLRLISWWRQDIVRNAKVMVIGAGALGNEVLKNLALMGIGKIWIVDFDTIEDSNLSRSVLFRQEDRGLPKAEVAAERIRLLNPHVRITPLAGDVGALGLGLFRRMDLVIGCVDNRLARLLTNRACWHVNKPWVDGGIEVMLGVARVFWPGRGACYECTLNDLDWRILSKRFSCTWYARQAIAEGKVPTTPTLAAIIGAIQCQEALKILHGMDVTTGKGIYFSAKSNETILSEYPTRSDCQSHWAFEPVIELSNVTANGTRIDEFISIIKDNLGPDVFVELNHDLIVGWRCYACNYLVDDLVRLEYLDHPPLICPHCRGECSMITTHRFDGTEPWAEHRLAELGIPALDIIKIRQGDNYRYFELTGDTKDFFDK